MKKISTLIALLTWPSTGVTADWQAAGFQSSALNMCAQLPYNFTVEQKATFNQLSNKLYFASEQTPESKQAFLDGTMAFLSSLERDEKAVFADAENAVMATLTQNKCLDYTALAEDFVANIKAD